jgi:tetratricopeptide (TPR) repeat protein
MKIPAQLIGFLLMFSACVSKESRVQKFLLKGNIASKERNWEQAAYYYGEAIRIEPCFTDAWNNLGTVHFRQKNYEKAMQDYEKAVSCSPQFTNALINRANTAYELKEYFKAVSDLEKVIALKPDTSIAYFTLGLTYTRLREFKKSLDAFEKAARLAGPDKKQQQELAVNHAIVQYYLRRYDTAKAELQATARLDDREPNIYNTLGLIETEQGHLQEAMNYINEAIRLAPHQSYYVNNRGYVFLLQNDLAHAEVDINESISNDPDNAWAYRNKGIYYLRIRNFSQAERVLKQSLAMDSFVDRIYYYLGLAYWYNNKKDLACASFKKSEELRDGLVTADLIRQCK